MTAMAMTKAVYKRKIKKTGSKTCCSADKDKHSTPVHCQLNSTLMLVENFYFLLFRKCYCQGLFARINILRIEIEMNFAPKTGKCITVFFRPYNILIIRRLVHTFVRFDTAVSSSLKFIVAVRWIVNWCFGQRFTFLCVAQWCMEMDGQQRGFGFAWLGQS